MLGSRTLKHRIRPNRVFAGVRTTVLTRQTKRLTDKVGDDVWN